jgi:hypothetical protein
MRDEVVDYVRYWSDKTDIKAAKMIGWLNITRSKYYDWRNRYGKDNEHNAWIPRDSWLTHDERHAIIDYYQDNPLEGYRRLLDRLTHRVHILEANGESYRLKEARKRRKTTPKQPGN